jgi:hypothetical protein
MLWPVVITPLVTERYRKWIWGMGLEGHLFCLGG